MKFSILSIFKHKVQNGLQGMITTKDKIEEIKYKYAKDSERYIKSAQEMLTNAKILKAKYNELTVQTVNAQHTYEQQIEENQLNDAKVSYIKFKGLKAAKDTIEQAWNNTEAECVRIRDNLNNIDNNKALIDAKLAALQAQIDALKLCDSNTLGDFGVDCNEMINEIEKEVQNTQFKMEAKREVSDIVNHRKPLNVINSTIDLEFEDVVKNYQASK